MESDKHNLTKETSINDNSQSNASTTLGRKQGSVAETWRPRRSRSRSTSENTSDIQQQLKRHASQATMWYTTVPQSITTHSLGSRHAPTRRSLRHSRMLVLSKSGCGKDEKKRTPQSCHQIFTPRKLIAAYNDSMR